MFSGVAVALPALGHDLGAGAVALNLVETLFLAGGLAFLLPVGWLADATDKRTLFKIGMLGFGLSSVAIGALSSVPLILVVRFIQGLFSAIFSTTGPAILAEIVPPDRRGRAFGASIGSIYAGLSLGPICAGLIVDASGWRAVFFIGAAVLAAGYLLVQFMMRSQWRRPTRWMHWPSVALLVVAVLAVVIGSATVREGPLGYALLAGGLILGGVFLHIQRSLTDPLLDLAAVVRNRALASALLVQMLLYMNAFAAIFLLSLYMQASLGHPARRAGLVLAIGSLLMALLAPVAGRLTDRLVPRTIASFGVVGVLAATILGTMLHRDSTLLFVGALLAIHGVGYALFSTPNMTIIMNSVPAAAVSMASALGAKSRSLGMVGGMVITGVMISLTIGNEPVAAHPLRFIATVRSTFVILASLTAAALLVSLITRAAVVPSAPDRS